MLWFKNAGLWHYVFLEIICLHFLLQSIVQEIVSGQEKRKSAGPTAGEYRELIKANLKTASEYLIPVSLMKANLKQSS